MLFCSGTWFCDILCLARSLEPLQRFIGLLEVKRLGVEFFTQPLQSGFMAFVLGVFQSLKQVFISPNPAAILRRAGPGTVDALHKISF